MKPLIHQQSTHRYCYEAKKLYLLYFGAQFLFLCAYWRYWYAKSSTFSPHTPIVVDARMSQKLIFVSSLAFALTVMIGNGFAASFEIKLGSSASSTGAGALQLKNPGVNPGEYAGGFLDFSFFVDGITTEVMSY